VKRNEEPPIERVIATERRGWDAERQRARDNERRRAIERQRQRHPGRLPADNVYTLLERISRRESLAARGDVSRCALCGRPLTSRTMTIDHTTARALGGEDTAANLQATCNRCNNLKSRLESAVRAKHDHGALQPGVVADVLHDIPKRQERERFAAHPSVQALMAALAD
jgi:5-methylcytosine-specific restriction endonuclease McrA